MSNNKSWVLKRVVKMVCLRSFGMPLVQTDILNFVITGKSTSRYCCRILVGIGSTVVKRIKIYWLTIIYLPMIFPTSWTCHCDNDCDLTKSSWQCCDNLQQDSCLYVDKIKITQFSRQACYKIYFCLPPTSPGALKMDHVHSSVSMSDWPSIH